MLWCAASCNKTNAVGKASGASAHTKHYCYRVWTIFKEVTIERISVQSSAKNVTGL
jgi:hypothetical protein